MPLSDLDICEIERDGWEREGRNCRRCFVIICSNACLGWLGFCAPLVYKQSPLLVLTISFSYKDFPKYFRLRILPSQTIELPNGPYHPSNHQAPSSTRPPIITFLFTTCPQSRHVRPSSTGGSSGPEFLVAGHRLRLLPCCALRDDCYSVAFLRDLQACQGLQDPARWEDESVGKGSKGRC